MVSRGSAASSLRYGEKYNAHFVANFVHSRAVKNFENRSISHEVIDMSRVSCFFLTHSVYTSGVLLLLFISQISDE